MSALSSNSEWSKIWQLSRTYFLNWDTWKTSCTPSKDGGNVRWYATYPTCSRVSKGPINLGLSFPRLPNLITLFVGDIFKNTKSLTSNSSGFLSKSSYRFYLSRAALRRSRMILTFSTVCWITSDPNNLLSPMSSQHKGDLCILPYNASNGAILILDW